MSAARVAGAAWPGRVPGRVWLFITACAAWLGAMHARPDSTLAVAGGTWFANWIVQMAVAGLYRRRPFLLPEGYYTRDSWPLALLARLPGLDGFGRAAAVLHPFRYDRRRPQEADARMRGAETTHAITGGVMTAVAAALAAGAAPAAALTLCGWNVVFNVYPVALQRRNRERLSCLARRRAPVRDRRGARPDAPSGHLGYAQVRALRDVGQ